MDPSSLPAGWSVAPFFLLLFLIGASSFLFKHFWEKYFAYVAALLAAFTLTYYLVFLGNYHLPLETLVEYLSFVILLASLFLVSSGIYIHADYKSTPLLNVGFLIFGAVIANLIGTTGAAMLLIRPFIRLNKYRMKPYHMVFFIFVICNVGGVVTPIGDPPLFIGYLKGVPFNFTVFNLGKYWMLAVSVLCTVFYFIDRKNVLNKETEQIETSGKIHISGKRNLLWLAIIITAIFLNPNLYDVPYIAHGTHRISFIREIIQLTAALLCYVFANKTAMNANRFTFAPILEVVFIFFGIFFTMMPVLQWVEYYGRTATSLNPSVIYWTTGGLSAFLDNAPTYLNFLAASMANASLDVDNTTDVQLFVEKKPLYVILISVASVFFGACTYLGNGPNLMVKSIAEELDIEMPSFVCYITHFVVPYLLPVLIITWLWAIYF